jgi:uncharacterized protein YoxC
VNARSFCCLFIIGFVTVFYICVECARTAKAVKLWSELSESRRDREEAKQEMRRIQALRENDMEAYSKLVQETKNERLHYLMNQTDSYLAKINELVQNQRSETEDIVGVGSGAEDAERAVTPVPDSAASVNGSVDSAEDRAVTSADEATAAAAEAAARTLTKASREYYETTHKKHEKVSQPTILKGTRCVDCLSASLSDCIFCLYVLSFQAVI